MANAITIGRERGSDLLLTHETASRKHARAERLASGAILITDLGSKNGTFRISDGRKEQVSSLEIGPSDSVGFGDQVVSAREIGTALARAAAASPAGAVETRWEPIANAPAPQPAPANPPIPAAKPAQSVDPFESIPEPEPIPQPAPAPKSKPSGSGSGGRGRPRRHPETNEIIYD